MSAQKTDGLRSDFVAVNNQPVWTEHLLQDAGVHAYLKSTTFLSLKKPKKAHFISFCSHTQGTKNNVN